MTVRTNDFIKNYHHLETTQDNSMDVLILEPKKTPLFLTIPTTSQPFEFLLGEDEEHVFTNSNFGFLSNGYELGLERNVRIGVNPIYANIHGPIVYAHPYASLTEEEVVKILTEHGFTSYTDARLFKDRPAYQGPSVSHEELISQTDIFLYRLSEREITDEIKDKYFVEGYEELSLATSRILNSFHGFFIVNFARNSGWNPVETGLNTKKELIEFASSIPTSFQMMATNFKHFVETGQKDKEDAISDMSSVYVLVKPVEEALAKVN